MTRYGKNEARYAEPFAEALRSSQEFRTWVLERTEFRRFASSATLLDAEMQARRSKTASSWWRSHWRSGCDCEGCAGGQETDLLAVFSSPSSYRFALHVEVKQPKDRFPASKDQAANYAVRAQCWARSAPKAVVPHQAAVTLLLCSQSKLGAYAPHLSKFGAVLTFEDITNAFGEPFLRQTTAEASAPIIRVPMR